MRKDKYIPLWQRYAMTIREASHYFAIGETKLRALVRENPTADYIMWNGNRALIKREMFEEYLNGAVSI